MIWWNGMAFEDGVEDRVFSKVKGLPVECLCTGLLQYRGFITFVMGISDVISEYLDYKSFFEVPSVSFDPGTDSYGCVSDITIWDVNLVSIKYISVGGGEFILLA